MDLILQQNAEMRCILPKSLLDHGFFPSGISKDEVDVKSECNQVCAYSWSGHRKMPSYINKLVFPDNFLGTLRTIAMNEDQLFKVSAMLEEVRFLQSTIFIHKNAAA